MGAAVKFAESVRLGVDSGLSAAAGVGFAAETGSDSLDES